MHDDVDAHGSIINTRAKESHAREALGLPKATWLTFRRTFSTWADARGVSTKMRAELMGHGPEINQNVYTKVIPESLRNAAASVASELFANCSQSPNWEN